MMFLTITTYAVPVTVAALLALYLGYIAGGRIDWPMLLDGLLLALYLWRPGWVVLGAVALLGSVRHIDAWTLVAAKWFKCAEHQGWTLRLWIFLLPALLRYTNQKPQSADPQPGAFGATTALPPMVEAKPAEAATELPLLLDAGLRVLNNDPTAPHVGVIGATRLGKTTFVGVLLAYREGSFVIATPKAAQYDPWFGADVARPKIDLAGDNVDYSPIDQAISSVHQEMLRRNTPGASATPAITLVVDEWTQVVSELPSLAKKVINLLRMGAGCGIRLILMATDVNVRGWKMDGSAGVLDNLVFARVEGDRQWSLGRLDPNWRLVSPRRLDTGQVHGLAARVSLAGRGWVGARVTATDPLLGGLLGRVPVPPAGTGGSPSDLALGTGNGTGTEQGTPVEVLKILRASGKTREWARANGCKFRDLDWTEAGKETI